MKLLDGETVLDTETFSVKDYFNSLYGKTAQYGIAQRNAVLGVNVAEGRIGLLCFHGYALEHDVHVDFLKAGHESIAHIREVNRYGNDDFFVPRTRVEDGDLGLGEVSVVEVVVLYVVLHAQRGIYTPGGVHKGKLLELVELLHARLIRLETLRTREILFAHEVDGNLHVLDVPREIGGNHLFTTPGKLAQI